MIYLVSNIHRSGSSMMMRCLEAGGLDPVYDKYDDLMIRSAPYDYNPNPNGFYQFGREVNANFHSLYDGRLVKCPIRDLTKLPTGNYKVCLMKRNPAEIRASMGKWTPYRSWGNDDTITYFYDLYINSLIASLQSMPGIAVVVLNYADVIANPAAEFQKLVDDGWPLNISAMVPLVQPSLYRHKLENV